MKDHEFEALIRDAAQTYNRPPDPPLDAMWVEIRSRDSLEGRNATRPGHRTLYSLLRIAAVLVIGVGLGRVSASVELRSLLPVGALPIAAAANDDDDAFRFEATRYLGQTAALLIALPSEANAGRADGEFVERAGELLLTTRLLLDSPTSSRPTLRVLLEDLELVLAQIVRLQNDRASLDLINQAIEQRDVIPRLRTVAADFSAD